MIFKNTPYKNAKYLFLFFATLAFSGCTFQASIDKFSEFSSQIIDPENDNNYNSAKLQYSFNGPILNQVIDGKTAYIAGSFTSIGKVHSGFFTLTGKNLSDRLNVAADGPVYASDQDAQGRVYIYGAFTKINGVTRHGLARLTPTGAFDPTFPDMEILGLTQSYSGAGYGLTIINDVAYLIGAFTSIKGSPRNGGASINLTTLSITDWVPYFQSQNNQVLTKVDTQNIAISGINYFNNTFDGVGYIDTNGAFQQYSPAFSTFAPNFNPITTRTHDSGHLYLFSANSYLRFLANGNYDSAFGTKQITGSTFSNFSGAPVFYGNDFLILEGTASGYDVKRFNLNTGSLVNTTSLPLKVVCSGSSTIAPSFNIVTDPINSRVFISGNCALEIVDGGSTVTHTNGFAAFDYSGSAFTLNSFSPAHISASNALVMGMKVFDGILYLNDFYNAVAGFDLTTFTRVVTLDTSVSWPVNFDVSAQGLFILKSNSGSPSSTNIYSFNHKTGSSITGLVTPSANYINVPNYNQNLHLSGGKLLVSRNEFSGGGGSGNVNENFYIFNLDGTHNELPMPKTAGGSTCKMPSSGPSGICVYGKNMGGTKAKGLYVYNTATKTENISRDTVLSSIITTYSVTSAYFDDEYEAYIINAPFDYVVGAWASYAGTYSRLYVFEKGQSTPLYVKRVSDSNSKMYIQRHNDKLVIAGLAYIADVSWDDNANFSNCTSGCFQLGGLGALDIASGTIIPSYGSELTPTADNYNHSYRYLVHFSGDGNYFYLCKDGGAQGVYDATTGMQAGTFDFQILNSPGCGARTNLINGKSLIASNASIFYESVTTGPVVAVDMETGNIEDLLFDGTITAFNSVGNELYIAGQGITTALGLGITSSPVSLISVKKSDRAVHEVDLSSFQTLFSAGIFHIDGTPTRLVIASLENIGFFNRTVQGVLTPQTKMYGASVGAISDLKVNSGQLYLAGTIQDIATATLPALSDIVTYNVAGNIFRIDLADLSPHTVTGTLVPSTYGAMLSLPPRLRVIDDDIYLIGLEQVNGSAQSIAKFKAATGVLDNSFKPFVSLLFSGMTLNSLIIDFVKTPQGSFEVIGLFTADHQGTALENMAGLNSTTGAISGTSSLPIPAISLLNIDLYTILYSSNNTPLIFSKNPTTSVSTFSIY